MRRNKLFSSIQYVTLLGAATIVTPHAFAQDSEEAQQVEEIVVMGSRIKRSSEGIPAGAPITTIGKVEMEATGSMIVSDVLRQSPLNSLGSFSERSGNSAQSNATVDLRGIGSDRTLVMLNGRRLAGSPNLGANSVNINMLPMAVIENVNIMADGGSAVYGSDAVAGVVDMVTYSEFDGTEFSFRYGDRAEDDGTEEAFSFVTGSQGENSNSVFGVEYNKRSPIFARDRWYTQGSTEDKNGNGVLEYDETVGVSQYSRNVLIIDKETGYEHFGQLGNCEGDLFTANIKDGDDTVCGYNWADVAANKAGLEKLNSFYSTTYNVSDSVDFFFDGLFSRVESFGRYAPPAATWRNMPADNPTLPADMDITLDEEGNYDPAVTTITGYYRWDNIGPRDNNVTDIQFDLTAGFRGDITDDIAFSAYAQHDRYESKEFGTYYLSRPGLEYQLNRGIDPFEQDANGNYPNAAPLRATTSQDNSSDLNKVYGDLQFGLGDLMGFGDVYALAGAEYFKQKYVNQYDSQSEAGLVGGSSGNSSEGSRNVLAAFSEVIVPLPANAELNLAVRYDNYSDFGTNVSPSASFTWAAGDSLTLRSRFSQGFRAPALSELYGPVTEGFPRARDWVTCRANNSDGCASRQYQNLSYTNPDLKAETSESFSSGFNWVFFDSGVFENWFVDLNYFNIEIDDVIGTPSIQSLIYAEMAGNTSVTDGSSRPFIDRTDSARPVFSTQTINVGQEKYSGVDVKLGGDLASSFGQFGFNTFVTYQLERSSNAYFEGPLQDLAGFSTSPKFRGQVALDWSLGSHRVDFIYNYIASHPFSSQTEVDPSSNTVLLVPTEERFGGNKTMNMSYSYNAGSFGRIRVGVNNLTNQEPSLDLQNDYSEDLYDNTGRVLFAEYKIKL